MVTHYAEADIADVFIGKSEERPFQLSGDRLVLTPEWDSGGKHWTGVRVFERAPTIAPIEQSAVATLRVPGDPDFLVADVWLIKTGRVEKWSQSGLKLSAVMLEPCDAMEIAFGSLWTA